MYMTTGIVMCIQHLKIIFEYLINHLIGIGKYSNVMCVCEWSMHIEWLETLLPLYSRRVCAEDLNMEYFFLFSILVFFAWKVWLQNKHPLEVKEHPLETHSLHSAVFVSKY